MIGMRACVIVLNYRGERVLPGCLAAAVAGLESGDGLLVVDNGNETDLMRRMRERFPILEVIVPEQNLGFAAGMNRGIQRALEEGYDAVWLVNNDAEVRPDALRALKTACFRGGRYGLYSPVIRAADRETVWFSGGTIDFLRMRVVHETVVAHQTPYVTEFLTGCALFLTREVIERNGFLDERFFLYYEDAAYSWKARKNELSLTVVPAAEVVHSEESQHAPEKIYWLVRSGTEFFLRESPIFWQPWVRCYLALRRLKNQIDILWGRSAVARSVRQAYTDASPYA
jgi:GT2 family glycosyltransferase